MSRLAKVLPLIYLCCAIGVNAQTVTITSGGTYSGHNLTNTVSNEPAISIQTTEPVTIEYCSIATTGYGTSAGTGCESDN